MKQPVDGTGMTEVVGRVREGEHLTVDQITTCKDSRFSRGNTRERIETHYGIFSLRAWLAILPGYHPGAD